MLYVIRVNDKFKKYLPNLINNMEGKNLILSLIQENRDLEMYFDIIDEIIYDNSDYLNNIVDLEQVSIEIDDNIDIVPSSYKMKVKEYDFNSILNDIESVDYDNILILIDDKLDISNLPNEEIIYSSDLDNIIENEKLIITDNNRVYDNNKIYGYLNDNESDLKILIDNLQNNTLLNPQKKSFIQRIKGIFKWVKILDLSIKMNPS